MLLTFSIPYFVLDHHSYTKKQHRQPSHIIGCLRPENTISSDARVDDIRRSHQSGEVKYLSPRFSTYLYCITVNSKHAKGTLRSRVTQKHVGVIGDDIGTVRGGRGGCRKEEKEGYCVWHSSLLWECA